MPPRTRFPFLIGHCARQTQEEAIPHLLEGLNRLESSLAVLLQERESAGGPAGAPGQPAEVADFFCGLVPILDRLDAVRRVVEESGQEEWRRGFALFYEKLLDLLSAHQFEPTAEVGCVFDPQRHEAVGATADSDLPAGRVAEIIQPGWIHQGRILRYARVTVSKR